MATTANFIKGGLTINEVGSDPNGTPGYDTDGSGSVEALADEFIEIVNVSGSPISLAGVEVWEDQLVHSFSSGTLAAGEVLLILDNTADLSAAQTAYPGAMVVQASGSLALANSGDGLALVDTASGDYVALNYGNAVGGDTAADSPNFPGTNLIGTDNTALTPDGQSIQRMPAGDENLVEGTATPAMLCFAQGTLIATPLGEIPVEALEIGHDVTTAAGGITKVLWIGRQTVVPASALLPERLEPVRFAAGALGNDLPHSDLIVTADHGMIIDGLVINASALVNGTTIDWMRAQDLPPQLTYYHIETENHEVIRANGAPAETFVDYVGRQAFDNYDEYVQLFGFGDARNIPDMGYVRISSQRMVPDRIRARLNIGMQQIGHHLRDTA